MKSFLRLLLFWRRPRKDYYRCGSCGYIFPEKGAPISGWNDHPHGFHMHCPECGATVDQFVKKPSET
jgi:rubredoxin